MAIGTDTTPYIVFWNPNIQNNALTSVTLPNSNLHSATVTGLKFTSNNMLVSVSKDGYVKKWNYASLINMWDTDSGYSENSVGLLNNGKLVTGSDYGYLREWDLSTGVNPTSYTAYMHRIQSTLLRF